MKYIIRNKEEGWLYCVKGKVKEFDDGYKCVKYLKRNKLEDKFEIAVDGIDEEKNKEFLKYL